MRFLLLFLAGFLPLALADGLHDRHGQVRGAAPVLALTLLLGALLAGPTRLLLIAPLQRLLRRGGAAAPSADALALGAGLAWAMASLLLARSSVRLKAAIYDRPFISALVLLLVVTLLIVLLPRLRPALRAPRTPALALLVLAAAAALGGFLHFQDGRRLAARAGAGPAAAGLAAAPRQPNVILVVLDTARAEALGGRFEGDAPMPWFDAFAASGRRWERGYAGANMTPPGHAALFTGLYPADCGTLSKGQIALPLEQLTLAEFLHARGWRGAAVVSNVRVGTGFGFQQGFEIYDDSLVSNNFVNAVGKRLGASALVQAASGRAGSRMVAGLFKHFARRNQDQITAADTTRRVGAVLDELDLAPEEPLFLFVNYIDPHLLYVTRPDLAAAFGPNLRHDGLEAVRNSTLLFHARLEEMTGRLAGGAATPAMEEELRWVREAYYEQCRELDEGLRGLFEDLERRGRAGPDDVILITSDHGEELGEHAEFLHGTTLFEASVRVPYWLRAPGVEPGVEADAPVSGVDFFPTVLEAIGLPGDGLPRPLAGVALQRPVPGDRLVRFESGPLRGFVQGARKMIARDHGNRLEWLFAFDLDSDPGEHDNLLRREVPEWARAFALKPPFAPSLEALEVVGGGFGAPDLAALGYADEAGGGN